MAAITVTPANVSANQNMGSIIRNYQAAVALTVGQVVYIDTNGKANPAVGNVLIQNARAVGVVVNQQSLYGETTIPAGNFCSVCTFGPVQGYSGLNPGQAGWVDKTTPGAMVDAAPTGGVFQFIVGRAVDAVTFFVDPGETAPASV